MDIEKLRDGIFALKTRRFGNVAEIMIEKLYALSASGTLEYDKYNKAKKQRIEIKFSTVLKNNEEKINDKNVVEQILKANFSNRALKYKDAAKYAFDCNIQQVKCNSFDILYYGMFFADCVCIFKMTASQVKKCKGYSNKQHRGNVDEGQFHINNDTFKYHLDKYLIKKLDYNQLYNLFK